MIELSRHLRSGDGIWWTQAGGEPTPLLHALLDQLDSIGAIRAFCGMLMDDRIVRELPPALSLSSYGALGELRRASKAGRLDVVPANYSALPRLFAAGLLPCDVGLVQVSPPDADGLCSLGIGVDYAADAVPHTGRLIGEINQRMPATRGSTRIPLERFAAVIETDRPLAELPERAADEVETSIAAQVAGLVSDRDTLQLGVGSLPTAVLQKLSGHRDLGLHSGLISDGVADLVDKGVITGAYKEIDAGLMVTGAALGRSEFYDRLPVLPVLFKPASYTHAPATLGRLRRLVAVNSAIEVDLTGQVGAELRRGVYVGAVGGQLDFSHAAAVSGARSIIAIRSCAGSESTIQPQLRWGPATTGRADVDYVVTEFGAAELRGATLRQRAQRLIAIAAPQHREALQRDFARRDKAE
ncbi:MAG: putative 4-hydroxybutyrate CoA-transferase [Frankiales bacterium]|nr:putative 4-hydroxybutyrate CoA-transferase [Frankiales bacterium]